MARTAPSVQIRPAAAVAERTAALALREEIFCGEQGVALELERDGRDEQALHLVAIEGGSVVGTCRLLFERGTAKLGRLAVAPPARGRGTGGRLVAAAEQHARARGASRVALHAQLRATGLYAAAGFRAVGPPFEQAGIQHVCMEKRLA